MTLLANPTRATGSDLDVTCAVRRLRRMGMLLPKTSVLYDVATRRDTDLLRELAHAGAGFAVPDARAARACVEVGAPPTDLLSTAVLTSCDDVAELAAAGVGLFVVRSPEDACRVAIAAPGSAVLVRVVPLSVAGEPDTGCSVSDAVTVLRQAAASGLETAGVSFEIASLRRSPRAWASAVGAAARVFGAAAEASVRLDTVDLGGGLPALEDGAPPLATYAATLERALHQEFGLARPHTLVRPGRALIGAAAA